MRCAFGVLAGALILACGGGGSSGSSTPCNQQYDCKSGQTCWTADGKSYSCMPSGPAQAGDMCAATPGPAPCADHLGCVAVGASQQGVCDYWCYVTDSLPCTAGSCISETDVNNVTVSFCE
jgi:hypothetical protein